MNARVALLTGLCLVALLTSSRASNQDPPISGSPPPMPQALRSPFSLPVAKPLYYLGLGGAVWIAVSILRRKPDPSDETAVARARERRKRRAAIAEGK